MIEPNSEAAASEYFVVAENIIPLRQASVDYIINTEFTEEHQIVPDAQVKKLVVQNRTTNPLSRFFVKVSSYLDSLQTFLGGISALYKKDIEQRKSIYSSEEVDQQTRTQRAKSALRKTLSAMSSRRGSGDLSDSNILLAVLAALGLEAIENVVEEAASIIQGPSKVYGNVTTKFSSPKSGQNTSLDPAWIPFPKGTRGLTFTSGYGQRTLNGRTRLHAGIDIAGPVGTPIITPISGVVVRATSVSGYGNMVTVKKNNLEMDFAHLNSIDVTLNDDIKAGTKVGGLGNTGIGTGPHLHWNIYINGQPVDPAQWTIDNPPETNQQAEGGVNLGRIMVGEAGPEFVIPMSQMPDFADLMMRHKIQSMDPDYYIGRSLKKLGVKGLSSFGDGAMRMMGEGGITKGIEWIKEEEGISSLVPGRNKYVKPSWPEYKNVTDRTVFHAYETGVAGDRTTIGWGFTFLDEITSGKKSVTPGMTMTKKEADDLLEYQVRHYHDNFLDTKYYPKFKYFSPEQQAGVILYGFNQPYFWNSAPAFSKAIEDGNLREASEQVGRGLPTREKIERMLLRSGPLQIVGPKIVGPKVVGPGKVGSGLPLLPDLTIDKFFNPGKYGDQSSLNTIPGNEQMQVANETQEQFSFDDAKGSIVALYQPTVHYEEEV